MKFETTCEMGGVLCGTIEKEYGIADPMRTGGRAPQKQESIEPVSRTEPIRSGGKPVSMKSIEPESMGSIEPGTCKYGEH